MTKPQRDKRYNQTDNGKAYRRAATKRYESSLRGWCMKQCRRIRYRCTRERAKMFYRYGARGISLQFTGPQLAKWIERTGQQWRGKHLHRINNDKGYSLNNIALLSSADHRAAHNDSCPI